MSSYINFYKKDKKTQRFTYLCSFSRNNPEYEWGEEYIPYGTIRLLGKETLDNIMASIHEEDANYEKTIKEYNERKELIARMNNSVDEKMEAIHEIDSYIRETSDIHDELNKAYWFYRTLRVIADDNISYKDNIDDTIYAGIDNPNPNNEKDEDE